MTIIAIDIGGTNIKFGVVNTKGVLSQKDSIPTEAHLGGLHIIKKIFAIYDNLSAQQVFSGIAISSAGQINNETGTVIFATDSIPYYTGTEIATIVTEYTGLPVTVENDVNCTALGEYFTGAAKQVDHFLCITVGTGIGGALFVNGELYTGSHYSAGEIGHICLIPYGRPCTCGQAGCLEQYISSSALLKEVTETLQIHDLRDFFQLVQAENTAALIIFNRWIDYFAIGLQSLVYTLNPTLIVIGGGISAQGSLISTVLEKKLQTKLMPNHRKNLRVQTALHQNDANLIGAAYHYYSTSTKGNVYYSKKEQ
ncbi:ROK family protein [Kurthia sibirica]|uniref:ROK family protein n=1 Tax=Kurthia sibirica TaxID=202750 RepID=A0A2U3AR33_9BACL|nr:ROK family protein [Kurthia sibirica]PWI26997.1 ROK family protein [Kurthia sibirica]GEK34459.1 N-acetylmannosamine kinase [Kurthia sibirica]